MIERYIGRYYILIDRQVDKDENNYVKIHRQRDKTMNKQTDRQMYR